MKKFVALIFFLIFLSSFSTALASIYTCDRNGTEKTSFYLNESVYVASDVNITNESKTIKFYVASHRTWSFGTNLTQASNFSKNINTNSSGYVPVSLLWSSPLILGNYDLIADVNENGTYDSGDLLYNASGDGFSVLEEPVPSLTVLKGENSPSDHNWYEENQSLQNSMLQVVLKAGSYEGVNVNNFVITALGTGDDRTGVYYVGVCLDSNKDGECGWGEEIVGTGQYNRDDGILSIDTKNKLSIAPNSSITLVFFYMMRNSSGSSEGKTYSFQLVMIDAFGETSGNKAKVSGLPISSAVKTVYSQAAETTTTSTTSTSTTTTIPITTTTTISKEEEDRTNLFVGLAVATFAAIAIITIFYFFFLRPPPQTYSYKP
jgi:hypothetical protein